MQNCPSADTKVWTVKIANGKLKFSCYGEKQFEMTVAEQTGRCKTKWSEVKTQFHFKPEDNASTGYRAQPSGKIFNNTDKI